MHLSWILHTDASQLRRAPLPCTFTRYQRNVLLLRSTRAQTLAITRPIKCVYVYTTHEAEQRNKSKQLETLSRFRPSPLLTTNVTFVTFL